MDPKEPKKNEEKLPTKGESHMKIQRPKTPYEYYELLFMRVINAYMPDGNDEDKKAVMKSLYDTHIEKSYYEVLSKIDQERYEKQLKEKELQERMANEKKKEHEEEKGEEKE